MRERFLLAMLAADIWIWLQEFHELSVERSGSSLLSSIVFIIARTERTRAVQMASSRRLTTTSWSSWHSTSTRFSSIWVRWSYPPSQTDSYFLLLNVIWWISVFETFLCESVWIFFYSLFIHSLVIFWPPGRTFPGHPYFTTQLGPGQLSLFNLLKAYSLLDREVGYCQGLSFVAGILLMHVSGWFLNYPETSSLHSASI